MRHDLDGWIERFNQSHGHRQVLQDQLFRVIGEALLEELQLVANIASHVQQERRLRALDEPLPHGEVVRHPPLAAQAVNPHVVVEVGAVLERLDVREEELVRLVGEHVGRAGRVFGVGPAAGAGVLVEHDGGFCRRQDRRVPVADDGEAHALGEVGGPVLFLARLFDVTYGS